MTVWLNFKASQLVTSLQISQHRVLSSQAASQVITSHFFPQFLSLFLFHVPLLFVLLQIELELEKMSVKSCGSQVDPKCEMKKTISFKLNRSTSELWQQLKSDSEFGQYGKLMILINYFFTKQYSRGVDTVHGFSIYVISLLIHSILI